MNPIIVIGLVSVVTIGLYSTYDGLEKQADLAALHADMLARAHASHTVFVSGEVLDGGENIILENSGAQPVELVQIRAYDSGGNLILPTWEMSYELPPLAKFNLTEATPAAPAALRGSVLSTSLGNDDTYRGVTSGGSIFEIEHVIPPNTPPPGTFGHMSAMPLTGSGGSRSHNGVTIYDYHLGDSPSICQQSHSGGAYTKWTQYRVYDGYFHTGTTLGGVTPVPSGTNTSWYFWYDEPYPHRISSWPLCGAQTPSPSDLEFERLHGSSGIVVKKPYILANHNIHLSLPVSGNFVAQSDGRKLLHVEIPVTATSSVNYAGAHTSRGENQICHTGSADGDKYFTVVQQQLIRQWESGLGASDITSSISVRNNGAPAGSFGMSDVGAVGDLSVDVQYALENQVASGGSWHCDVVLDSQLDGSWSHTGTLTGLLDINAMTGDRITFSGTVRLSYTPPTVTHAAPQTSYATLELGDAIVTVGTAP